MTQTVASYLTSALQAYTGNRTQTDIARAAGFNNPNMLSMIKAGRAKLPITRVTALCQALEVQPEELVLLVFADGLLNPEDNPLWVAFGGRLPTAAELRSLRLESSGP